MARSKRTTQPQWGAWRSSPRATALMPLDPITALANLVAEVTKLVSTIIASQNPDQQKVLWDWYIADVARWRKLFKLED